jgi:uncharacterized protein
VRIVVVADTHIPGFARQLPPALFPALRQTDLILHAGDVDRAFLLDELREHAPVRVVLGNNDHGDVAEWGATEEVHLEVQGVRIAMVHDSGPHTGREARMHRRFPDARLVVFGHSHIPIDVETDRGQRLFNPGSPTWKRRQPFPTYGVVTIAKGRLRTRIVELPLAPR